VAVAGGLLLADQEGSGGPTQVQHGGETASCRAGLRGDHRLQPARPELTTGDLGGEPAVFHVEVPQPQQRSDPALVGSVERQQVGVGERDQLGHAVRALVENLLHDRLLLGRLSVTSSSS